jgi:hypothetical protein
VRRRRPGRELSLHRRGWPITTWYLVGARHAGLLADHPPRRPDGPLEVVVDRGVVTLTGTMPSFQVTQAVLGAARLTPGVDALDDRLRITLNA